MGQERMFKYNAEENNYRRKVCHPAWVNKENRTWLASLSQLESIITIPSATNLPKQNQRSGRKKIKLAKLTFSRKGKCDRN